MPPLYNVEDPTLAGIPFFYWYQLYPIALLAAVRPADSRCVM